MADKNWQTWNRHHNHHVSPVAAAGNMCCKSFSNSLQHKKIWTLFKPVFKHIQTTRSSFQDKNKHSQTPPNCYSRSSWNFRREFNGCWSLTTTLTWNDRHWANGQPMLDILRSYWNDWVRNHLASWLHWNRSRSKPTSPWSDNSVIQLLTLAGPLAHLVPFILCFPLLNFDTSV